CSCWLSHCLHLAKNVRRLLSHGTRTKANLPPRSVPQTCLNPRKSNVSGFSPVFARPARTKRPKRITRVFSSANSKPNFPNRSVRFLWNASASRRYWKFTTNSSANLVRYASHGHQTRTMTLEANEFLRRFLPHVLPASFVRIRYFGLLANRHLPREYAEHPANRSSVSTIAARISAASPTQSSCPSLASICSN